MAADGATIKLRIVDVPKSAKVLNKPTSRPNASVP
jgi:hypothetical protein